MEIYFFYLVIKLSIQLECDKSTPIKKQDNKCYLIYCEKEDFDKGICTINNTIVKTQWLTDIINVGGETYRYVNLALSSNNDLFLQTTANPSKNENCFFGIKSNGRPYFNNTGDSSSIVYIKYNISSLKSRSRGQSINILLNDDDDTGSSNKNKNEYFMSIGKDDNNVELFDLESKQLRSYSPSKLIFKSTIRSKIFSLINYNEYNKNSYILTFIGKNDDNNMYYIFQKYEFKLNNETNQIEYIQYNYNWNQTLDENKFKFMVTCYQTVKKIIVCFYCNSNGYYTATLYDLNLLEQSSFSFGLPSTDQNLFFKCIHFKDEIGIFYYFMGENEEGDNKPIIDLVEFIKKDGEKRYTRNDIFKSLITKKDKISDSIYYNGIFKLEKNRFGIIQVSNNRETIYIIIYKTYNNDQNIIARYYTINLFQFYFLKIAKDMDAILYNSFLVTAFSFCNGNEEFNNCTNSFSSIIMFSYPNSSEYSINLIEHLKEYNHTFPLNEIIENQIKIDNNIFGLIVKGIKILLYPKNGNNIIISLYSYIKEVLVNENDLINKNEEIEFHFPASEINGGRYIIEFAPVVTEPSYDKYNSYCEIDEDYGDIKEEKKEFKKLEYIGKTENIYIVVQQPLTNKCKEENCFYCLQNSQGNCTFYKTPIEKEDGLNEKKLNVIYEKLKEMIKDKNFNEDNIIIEMKDILMQLSTIDYQEDSFYEDDNISKVLLGQCKEKLKERYNLQDDEILLMLKLDMFKKDSTIPIVEYEIYNYNNSEKLSLEACNDVKINVYVPIQLDNQTIYLYNNLNQSGYDLLNSNDSFYNDICSIYTTMNGTDISINDRQESYFNQSITLCQEGCTYDYFDNITYKVKCICPVSQISIKNENSEQEENDFVSTIVKIYNDKNILTQIFFSPIKNMNFKVMKCYYLVFELEYFMKNIGSILLTIFIMIFIFLMILYFIYGNKIIKQMVKTVIASQKKKGSVSFQVKDIKNGKRFSNIVEEGMKEDKNVNLRKQLYTDLKEKKNVKRRSQLYEEETKGKREIRLNKNKTLIENKNIINSLEDNYGINENKKKGKNFLERRKRKLATVKVRAIKLKLNCPPPRFEKEQPKGGLKRRTNKSKTVKVNKPMINFDRRSICSDNKTKGKGNEQKSKFKLDLRENERSINGSGTELVFNFGNSNSNSNFNFKKKKKFPHFVKEKNNKQTNEENDFKKNNINIYLNQAKKKSIKPGDLNDAELNQLDYRSAIILDRRTFLQYYFSLLKKKHLILFCFFPSNDYNILIIKISFFFIAFSLYITISGFFFSDQTMHKVYENNGQFNFVYQIPQIIYSSLISTIILQLLRSLSLSEKSILKLKKENNRKSINGKSDSIQRCLKIKLFIYFIFGLILMAFFWYFISSFCAVYQNTQTILLKTTMLSFVLSMIYPFGYVLLPGIFRIPALRAKNQDQVLIYNFSKILALL